MEADSLQTASNLGHELFYPCFELSPFFFSAATHYNLGNLYFEANDFRLAQMHYELSVEVNPSFPNVFFNLALVQAINNDLAAAVSTLTNYQQLVPKDEGRNADELLSNLKRTLAATDSRFGTT